MMQAGGHPVIRSNNPTRRLYIDLANPDAINRGPQPTASPLKIWLDDSISCINPAQHLVSQPHRLGVWFGHSSLVGLRPG
jgi:hypothetical protein